MSASIAKRRLRLRRGTLSLIFVVALLGMILGGGGYLGLFSTVKLAEEHAGPYTVVGIDHYGSTRKIHGVLERDAVPLLQKAELPADAAPIYAGALVDDRLEKIPKAQRHAVVGYVFSGDLDLTVEAPLKVVHVPARDVVTATIEAHQTVAAFKAYRKLREAWQSRLVKDQTHWGSPSLELYVGSEKLVVEMPVEPN